MKVYSKHDKEEIIGWAKRNIENKESAIIVADFKALSYNMNPSEMEKLYFLYEFSDSFQMIAHKGTLYADIFNYVDTGLLTIEEAVEALLH